MPILFNLLHVVVAVVVVVAAVVVVVVDVDVLTVKLVDPQRKRIHLKRKFRNFFAHKILFPENFKPRHGSGRR